MKLGVSLRTSQNLALTPQLQQSIRLLQLSTLEMEQEVEQMLDENPFLEREGEEGGDTELPVAADAPAVETPTDSFAEEAPAETDLPGNWEGEDIPSQPDANQSDWDSDWLGSASPGSGSGNHDNDGDDIDPATLKSAHVSLTEHLHQQASEYFLEPAARCALDYLIESLNEDGYLEDDLQDLALPLARSLDEVDELLHHFQRALKLLQTFEPAGVGARDLAECLQLQLRNMEREEYPDAAAQTLELAMRICQQPLDLLARRDIRTLVQLTRASADEVRTALLLIARLEPKPGRRFADVGATSSFPMSSCGPATAGARNSACSSTRTSCRACASTMSMPTHCATTAAAVANSSNACRKRAGSSRTSSNASKPSCGCRRRLWSGRRITSSTGQWPCARWCCARLPTNWDCTNPPFPA